MEHHVKIARWIFMLAAFAGLALLGSMYFFTFPIMPKAPRQQPEMYYGFATIGVAWQVAFLLIAFDPLRYRPMMLVAAVGDKLGFAGTLIILVLLHRAGRHWIPIAVIELVMGIAFLAAYKLTNATTLTRTDPNSI